MRYSFHIFTLILIIIFSACAANEQNKTEEETSKDNPTINSSNHENDDRDDVGSENSIKEEIDIISDDSYTVLVNKFNDLSDTYTPDDLVTVSVPTVLENPEVNQMRKLAADALADMFDAAEENGFFLFARSGFRSYDTQVHLFNGYADKHGEEAANTYSAKPGFSEHQTGLVMDITSESVQFELTEHFGDTPEGEWVKENAHHFGFIIRYPEGKEDVTGYIYEPWHLRYLGKDVAKIVYESNKTYEEFLVEEEVIEHVKKEKE